METNLFQLLQLVTKQALGSSKPTDVSRNLRKELCKKDSERFFMLSDSARLDSMTNQLCQLDDKQFDALVKDVNSQVDTTELVKQVRICAALKHIIISNQRFSFFISKCFFLPVEAFVGRRLLHY